ncbi:uncharacterized protein FA14DRAFT_177952 [Meira miltonrushii]|uniref:MaoC-like domain-containing protein n=1 Tax=Meira miltonrushii TaxID=1280837 RepID=A0A316VAK4_9BASI|nr:uncharacterized protein FA14DRAFT_177952 [Meira miltonrushii]PWN34546.1 hypothetical protein FA14DRAFT_177952 [Meira miltonrushii]
MIAIIIFRLFELVLLFWGVVASVAFYISRNRFNKLGIRSLSAPSTVEIKLQQSPTRFTGFDLFVLSLSVLCKYIPFTKGYHNELIPHKDKQQAFDLPLIQVSGPLRFDQSDIQRFQRALQPNVKGRKPEIDDDGPANSLFLVALTAPLVIYVLALHASPIKPLGAVNTRNAFHYHDPAMCNDITKLLQASNEGRLQVSARFGGPQNPGIRKKRGMDFSMIIEVRKHEEVLFTQELHFLQFLKSGQKPKFDPEQRQSEQNNDEDMEDQDSLETCALPRFDVTTPRLWASSCGDYNPIHILPLAAVLFGFPSVIAHGNHVVALAVEEARLKDQQRFNEAHQILYGRKPFTLDVQFIKPMVLPATFHVAWQVRRNAEGVRLIVMKGDRDCVIGSCYVD